MATTFSTGDGSQKMVVTIRGVDFVNKVYGGWSKISGDVPVYSRSMPGGVLCVPAVGDQWVVCRINNRWFLESKTDFQDPKLALSPSEGMTAIGGTGPTHVIGSEVDLPPSVFLGDWELRLEPVSGALQVRPRGGDEWTPVSSGGGGGTGSVTSADITDASATGRSVLTSSSPATARSTLGAAASANAKGFVNHGANAGTARPTGYASVEWYGSVAPTNATSADTWVNTA